MKNINKTSSYSMILGIVAVFIVGVLVALPTQARAGFDFGRLIDPLCLFACDNDRGNKKVITNTYTNSNNVNSNIDSPGATVNANTVYDSNVAYGTPVYNYDNNYNYNEPLRISCYPIPIRARVGDTVTWYASAYGGDNSSYHITWSGTNSLSGTGSSLQKRYNSEGSKSASIVVRSGNQTVSKNCDGTAQIYDDRNYNYDDRYDYDYDYNRNSPLYVSCSADRVSATTGTSVLWTANASGGDGRYTYSWDGTENLQSSSRSVFKSYSYTGPKYASITVRSEGRSITQYCSNTVNISAQYVTPYQPVYQPVYQQYQPIQTGLSVGCFADPGTARVNQPVSWKAEASGGIAPYTYTWTGTDGLSGSDAGLLKYYSTTGDKSAVVTVRSADGRTAVQACTNGVTVRAATTSVTPKPKPVAPAPVPEPEKENNELSASALFSLENVPWGWVAILIILVLFATVVYLLFNRQKI